MSNGQPDKVQFVANMPDIKSALLLSGSGDLCQTKLEAYGLEAIKMHVGMAYFAKKEFLVTITELSEKEKVLRMQSDRESDNSRKIHI